MDTGITNVLICMLCLFMGKMFRICSVVFAFLHAVVRAFKPANNDDLKNEVVKWCAGDPAAGDGTTPIGDWDVSDITDMSCLFSDSRFGPCSFSSYCDDFNDDIGNWNTSSVTNMSVSST